MRSLRSGARLLRSFLRVPSHFAPEKAFVAESLAGQISARQSPWDLEKSSSICTNRTQPRFAKALGSAKRTPHTYQYQVQDGPCEFLLRVREMHCGLPSLLAREQLLTSNLFSVHFSSVPGCHLAESNKGSADAGAGDDFVPSPLMQAPAPRGALSDMPPGKASASEASPAERVARAQVCEIAMSPKKLNLVAALVRRMSVKDALLQLKVSRKRAAKAVAKAIISARANGTHNHGLDGTNLFVDECFVGKGKFLKRLFPRAKGRSDIRIRPRSHLTVILKEMPPEREKARERLASLRSARVRRRLSLKLEPHKLVKTQWRWSRELGDVKNNVAKQNG